MPFFRYAATDAQGKAVQGTVQAASTAEAERALSNKGIRVTTWLDPNAVQAIPAAAPLQARLVSSGAPLSTTPPRTNTTPLARPRPTAVPSAGSTRAPLPVIHTRRGKDKDRLFLFTQISNFLRAGVNPAQAFGDMASRMRHDDFRAAMMKVAQLSAEGVPISDVLASYPDLFPPHVVGLVRAGEIGGFLPEACQAVAQQSEAAHKFRRSLWIVWVVIINAFLSVPTAILVYNWLPRAYEKTESAGEFNFGGGLSAVSSAFWELFWWPIAPLALLGYGIAYGLYLWAHSRPMTLRRHGWSLKTPILGGRAKNEGLSLFSWVLSKVAQAGVSPHRSWELGMDSVPNLALKDRLREAGGLLHSGERLSKAFFQSRLFPDEYAPMMATAEMTGDIPGTLQKLSDLSRNEFEISTSKSKGAAWVMSSAAIAATAGFILIMLVLMWYYRLPATVLKDLEP